jgi:hypothetical protein
LLEPDATVADFHAETHDRVAVDAGQSLSRADRDAFGQSGDSLDLTVKGENVHGANP